MTLYDPSLFCYRRGEIGKEDIGGTMMSNPSTSRRQTAESANRESFGDESIPLSYILGEQYAGYYEVSKIHGCSREDKTIPYYSMPSL